MKKFLITYNYYMYKPSNYAVYLQQKDWNKNPAYFNFKEC